MITICSFPEVYARRQAECKCDNLGRGVILKDIEKYSITPTGAHVFSTHNKEFHTLPANFEVSIYLMEDDV